MPVSNLCRSLALAGAAVAVSCVILAAASAHATSIAGDYSVVSNPNGDWVYGRTNDLAVSTLTTMNVRWAAGWYLGNVGHGGPSVHDVVPNVQTAGVLVWSDTGPFLWAKDNSNGYPVIRWTAPTSGTFSIIGEFEGADSRGVNNQVYVVINGTTAFSDAVTSTGDLAPFSLTNVNLTAGDHVDFLLTNTGGDTETGWTRVNASIVPEPSTALLVGIGLALVSVHTRRAMPA